MSRKGEKNEAQSPQMRRGSTSGTEEKGGIKEKDGRRERNIKRMMRVDIYEEERENNIRIKCREINEKAGEREWRETASCFAGLHTAAARYCHIRDAIMHFSSKHPNFRERLDEFICCNILSSSARRNKLRRRRDGRAYCKIPATGGFPTFLLVCTRSCV